MTHQLLIVDDDAPYRRALMRWFRHVDNVTVTEAASGEEALELVEGGYIPTAVLSDYNMCRMDGLALLAALRLLFPEIPLVLCSGRLEAVESCEGQGITGFLKPAGNAEIQAALGLA